MRRIVVISIATLSTLFIAAGAVPPAFLRSDAPALQVDISVAPVTRDPVQLLRRVTPDMYRCSVLVHDEPGSNRVWKTSDIVIKAGESGTESATFGPLELAFSASIDTKRERVEAVATLRRDGKVISRQRSSIFLGR